jgi:hypothetical protein
MSFGIIKYNEYNNYIDYDSNKLNNRIIIKFIK